MSDYLQNLVAGALGKPDTLQPRLPSFFEPVLSAGLPVGLTDGIQEEGSEEGPEEGTEQESDRQRHKLISRHNPDGDFAKLPASNPIETENGPGNFEFEVRGRRDAAFSYNLPLQSEDQAAADLPSGMNQFAREEPGRADGTEFSIGVLPDYRLHSLQEPESGAANSFFQPEIQTSDPNSKVERGSARGSINSVVKGEKTLFINKARREKSVLESEHQRVEEAVPSGNGVEMSDYLQNLVTGAMGKSDILQPRLPSFFEPVLSAGLPVGLTDGIMEEGPEEGKEHESDRQRHKLISGHNPDDRRTKLPASNPIETGNGWSNFESEVRGQRDAVQSNDLPLQPEDQAADLPSGMNQFAREEPGRVDGIELSLKERVLQKHKSANEPVLSRRIETMIDQNARATSNDEPGPANNSPFLPKTPPNNSYSKMESGLIKKRINNAVIRRRALSINKGVREKSVLESSPGREQAEALAIKMEEPDSRHQATASNRAHRIDHPQASEIKTRDAAFGLKRAAAGARSSQFSKQNSTEASREPSEQMPPSIKVTIGRIEVRAVTPPVKREPKKETRNPSTSLGDYLSSLRGGPR